MINRYVILISLSFLLLAFSLRLYDDGDTVPMPDKLVILDSQTGSLPTAEIDIDFSKIDHLIDDKDIIILGENLHYGGTTFAFKTQFVKYLCEEKGFRNILFEAGLYDIYKINNDVSKRTEAFWYFWSKTDEMDKLWHYIETRGDIRLAGFDVQLSGEVKHDIRIKGIDSILAANSIDMPRAIDSLEHSICSLVHTGKWFDAKRQSAILEELREIGRKLNDNNEHIDAKYFTNMADWYEIVWQYEQGNIKRFNARDSLMADNIIFLKENYFKDQKIIIWASNLHTMNTSNTSSEDGFVAMNTSSKVGFVSMGSILKEKYKDKMFTICTTYYGRENKNSTFSNRTSSRSIEHQLYVKGYDYALLDLSKIKNKSFRSRIYHGGELDDYWGAMTDAVFFMTAEKRIIYKSNAEFWMRAEDKITYN